MTGAVPGASVVAGQPARIASWPAPHSEARTGSAGLRVAISGVLLAAAVVAVLAAIAGVIHYGLTLLVLPPVAWVLRRAYGQLRRAADDRRTWASFAGLTVALNRLDERGVVVAALRGMALLFGPDEVELVVLRPSGLRWRFAARTVDIRSADGSVWPIAEGTDPTEPP